MVLPSLCAAGKLKFDVSVSCLTEVLLQYWCGFGLRFVFSDSLLRFFFHTGLCRIDLYLYSSFRSFNINFSGARLHLKYVRLYEHVRLTYSVVHFSAEFRVLCSTRGDTLKVVDLRMMTVARNYE